MQLTIRMPDEYAAGVESLAKAMGLKKSDIARLAIKEFIANHSADEYDYPYAKAKNLLGVAESGVKDLGQNHRKYLINKIRGEE